MPYDLALIFPCYNERQRVTKTFEAYLSYLKNNQDLSSKKIGMIFVDDGSADDTIGLLREFVSSSTENIKIKAIGYADNRGKGGAIKYALSQVKAQSYGFIDADNSFKPESLPLMLAGLEKSDFVLAQGAKLTSPRMYDRLRGVFSGLLKRLANFLIGIPDIDTQRGFKFFNQQTVDLAILPAQEDRFAFDLEVIALARKAGLRLSFVEVAFEHDERSTVTWRDGVRYLFDVVAIADRVRNQVDRAFWHKLAILALLIIASLFGWTVFVGYFFSDDFTWLWHGQRIGWSLNGILHTPMSTFFSPMLNLFYVAMFDWFGYASGWYYSFGLWLHLSSALLAGWLVWQLERSRLMAVVTVCLVAVAGGAYEPLVWLAANMHPWVTQWILLAITTYIAYHQSGRVRWLVLSILSVFGAFYTKEVAAILPVLIFCCYLVYWPVFKTRFWSKSHMVWLAFFGYACLWYAYHQYIWQKSSVWVASRVWGVSWQALFKAPIAALDLFVPISIYSTKLNQKMAIGLLLFSVVFLIWLVIRYWSLRLVRLGLAWIFVAMAPTIFFLTKHWWDPLSSRYTYLPRIGMIMILTSVLHYYIVANKSRHIVNGLVGVIALISFLQVAIMLYTVNHEYLLVYNTGRSLHEAMGEIKTCGAKKVSIRWDYPFTGNNAHIVGAASTIAGLREDQLVFLKRGQEEKINSGEALLFWQARKKQYEVDCRKN